MALVRQGGGDSLRRRVMPSASYTDFQFSGRSSRIVRILVTASAAALFGVAAGGASVFAIVTALEPASAPQSVPVNGAAEPISPVVTKVTRPAPTGPERDDVNTAPAAAVATPLTEANTEASAEAPQPLSPAPSGAEVQPWPDALTRTHRSASIATAKSGQQAPTPPRAPSTSNQTAPLPTGIDEPAKDNSATLPPRTGDHLKTIHTNLPARATITPPRQRAAELAPPAQRLPSDEASAVPQESLRGLFNLFTGDQVFDEQIPIRAKAPQQIVPPQAPSPRIGAKARAMQRGDFKPTARSPERAGVVVISRPEYSREVIQADEPRVRPDDGLFGLFGTVGRNTWDHERND